MAIIFLIFALMVLIAQPIKPVNALFAILTRLQSDLSANKTMSLISCPE